MNASDSVRVAPIDFWTFTGNGSPKPKSGTADDLLSLAANRRCTKTPNMVDSTANFVGIVVISTAPGSADASSFPGWVDIGANVVIGATLASLALALATKTRRRRHSSSFSKWCLLGSGGLILLAAIHLLDVVVLWLPWLLAVTLTKAGCAVAIGAAALAIRGRIPVALEHVDRIEAGKLLRAEMADRTVIESELRQRNLRLAERIAELEGLLPGSNGTDLKSVLTKAAHDLSNAATGISGLVSITREELESGSEAAKQLEQMENLLRSSESMVSRTLQSLREIETAPVEADLGDLVADAANAVGHLFGKGIELRIEVERPIPLSRIATKLVRQIVVNLLANANQAIGKQDGAVTVRIGTIQFHESFRGMDRQGPTLTPGRYLLLEVVDTGCGLTLEVLDAVLEPFFRRGPASGGFGLKIVAASIRQLGGAFTVSSEPGGGTSFRVILPVQPAREEMEEGNIRS